MEKNEILKQIMKHAVTGHGVSHTFCNDPDHAADILAANHMVVRPAFASRGEERRFDAVMSEKASDEGMANA